MLLLLSSARSPGRRVKVCASFIFADPGSIQPPYRCTIRQMVAAGSFRRTPHDPLKQPKLKLGHPSSPPVHEA